MYPDKELVRSWLIETNRLDGARLLEEAVFEFQWAETFFDDHRPAGVEHSCYELEIFLPVPLFQRLQDDLFRAKEQVDDALGELKQAETVDHVEGVIWRAQSPSASCPSKSIAWGDSPGSSDDLTRAWEKAKARIESDPKGAITAARTLLELQLKSLLSGSEVEFSPKTSQTDLYRASLSLLAPFSSDKDCHDAYRNLGSTIAHTITHVRRIEGDAHASEFQPTAEKARFIVNVAGALALLLGTVPKKDAEG